MIEALQPDVLPAVVKIVEQTETALSKLAGFPVKLKLSADVQELSRTALQTEVCVYFKTTWKMLLSRSRLRNIKNARAVYCWLHKYYWPQTNDSNIAAIIQRERSTVTTARNTLQLQLSKKNIELTKAVAAIQNKLKTT